jgi:hypothetical protein
MKKVLAAACTLTPSGIQIPPSTRGSRVFLAANPTHYFVRTEK